jgi:hypothetical protein
MFYLVIVFLILNCSVQRVRPISFTVPVPLENEACHSFRFVQSCTELISEKEGTLVMYKYEDKLGILFHYILTRNTENL